MSIQDTGLQDGDTFQYSIATKKRIYTFDWNGKLIHPEINVDLPISDVEVFVTNVDDGFYSLIGRSCLACATQHFKCVATILFLTTRLNQSVSTPYLTPISSILKL